MAYVQKNNPFPVTSCGRRRTFTQGGDPGSDRTESSPFGMRKTTKGKGRTFRSTKEGAGMTSKGVAAYKRENPGSKLKTAVTKPPSQLKPGSKPAKRRKAFCARSKSWKSERGLAARRKWNC